MCNSEREVAVRCSGRSTSFYTCQYVISRLLVRRNSLVMKIERRCRLGTNMATNRRPSQLSNTRRDLITRELLQTLKREELCEYLGEHGVNHSNKRKEELVTLCVQTARLNIPVRQGDDYAVQNTRRRTVRGTEVLEPSSTSLQWSSNLRGLPIIDMFDVGQFLLSSCGWTKQRIHDRKKDSAYQLHSNGHVHDVQIADIGNGMMYIRAKCVPETRQSGDPYKLWILLENTGQIFSAECSCVAGDGSCKHVVAAIFGLLAFSTDMEHVSVTDVPAYWTAPKRICKPVSVDELDIRRDITTNKKPGPTPHDGYETLPHDTLDRKKIEKDITKLLKQSNLASVALYVLSDSESDGSADFDEHPLNIIDLIKKYGDDNIDQHMDEGYIKNVSECTIGQSDNYLWSYQRRGRLTASQFYSALHYRGNNSLNSIVKSSLGMYKEFSTEATEYGKTCEPIARKQYVEHMFDLHTSFLCEDSGFYIYPTYPFLGASPDGIISCKCCNKGVVEIKCPFKFKDNEPHEAMENLSSFSTKNGVICLDQSENSPYYIQILGQMAVCNAPFCDFILYTKKGIYIERVPFNSNLWNSVFTKLKVFYQNCLLPSLLSHSAF